MSDQSELFNMVPVKVPFEGGYITSSQELPTESLAKHPRGAMAEKIDEWTAPAKAKHKEEIERLTPLAVDLARRAEKDGVTVSDLRLTAVQRGLMLSDPSGRQLSFLGAVMRAAGLVATDRVRRSTIDRSHGNRHTVWVLPEFSGRSSV